LGRPIAPIINEGAGFVRHLGQEAKATKRLTDAIGSPLERWASRSHIKSAFPTLQPGDPIRFRQQNAKDKLIGLIRKVRKKSGKTYWSKPQREDLAIKSTTIAGQRRIKAVADNYKGKF
jgi:hypothetical protein